MSKGFIMGGAGGENVSAEVLAQESLIEQIQAALEGKAASKIFAVIGVIYPEGSVCTCTDGARELVAKDTSGQAIFFVPYAGSWIVSCTDGEQTKSETVEITSEGQNVSVVLSYELWLYWNGDECEDVTGGFEKVYQTNGASGSVTNNGSTMTVVGASGNDSAICGASTKNVVDLSKLESLHINIVSAKKGGSAWAGRLLVVSESDNSLQASNALAYLNITEATLGELSLDVSGITEGRLIVTGNAVSGSVTFDRLWGEV